MGYYHALNWINIIWSMVAASSMTLAGVHLLIWLRNHKAWGSLSFVIMAFAIAGMASFELLMMHAQTTEQIAWAIRWYHVFIFLLLVSLVLFARTYLKAGRPWLAWTVCIMRGLVLLVNFTVGENAHYFKITLLKNVQFLGQSVTTIAEGVKNPWVMLTQLSLLLFVVFLIDAIITSWRKRQASRVMIICVALFVFVAVGGSLMWTWRLSDLPLMLSLFFMPCIVAMSYEMSRQIHKTSELSDGLQQKQEWMTLAADSANAGLWSWDYKTGKIWVTDQTRILYGLSSHEEVTAERFYKALHPHDLEFVTRVVTQAFRSGEVVRVEYRIVLPDKSIRWMTIRARAFLNASGEPEKMMGVSLDTTERRLNEEERMRLRNELAHLARVLTMNELSASLAHEINQPLGAILNNASAARELMAQGKNTAQDMNEILSDIVQDAKRAGDVVRKIRGMVKKGEVRFEPLGVDVLVNDVVDLFQGRIKIENISLHLDLQPGLPRVRGDRVQLQQVLLNLITNALEAMKGQTTKILTVRSHMTTPDKVTISVSNSGPAIEEAMKEKLFKSFFSTKEQGLGMGLPISRSIIEEHGGQIWVENDPVRGTTFSFTLKTMGGAPA